MLSNQDLEERFKAFREVEQVSFSGDGYHYHCLIVSDFFEGKSKLQRQQWVYEKIKEEILGGQLHALSIKALTKAEWEQQNG